MLKKSSFTIALSLVAMFALGSCCCGPKVSKSLPGLPGIEATEPAPQSYPVTPSK